MVDTSVLVGRDGRPADDLRTPLTRPRRLPRPRLVVPMPTDRGLSWAWAVAITVVAAVLRFAGLSSPGSKIFDEVYYAKDAHDLITHAVARNGTENGPGFVVHPPLAKWFIGAGEWLFGYDSFGWRVAAAVIGSLSILILIRVTRRMTRSTLLGCTAGLLLSLDGLHFVQSRVAMLDIFVMFWVLAAFACLVADRDDLRRRLDRVQRGGRDISGGSGGLGIRWWRWAGAACLGLGLATKWTALFYIPAFALLVLAWDCGARRTAGVRRPFLDSLRRSVPGWIGSAALIVGLFLACWAGWFATRTGWDRQWAAQRAGGWHGPGIDALRSLWHYQYEMYYFHTHLHAYHPYMSQPWSWLLMGRPVAYYYSAKSGCGAPSCSSEVLAIGTPALWWAFIPALVGVTWLWLARRDWRGAAVLVGFAACFLPLLPYPDRTMFFFYALPALPFLVIGVTLCLGMVLGPADASPERRITGVLLVAAYVALVAFCFAFFHPLLTGAHLTYAQWHERIWFATWI